MSVEYAEESPKCDLPHLYCRSNCGWHCWSPPYRAKARRIAPVAVAWLHVYLHTYTIYVHHVNSVDPDKKKISNSVIHEKQLRYVSNVYYWFTKWRRSSQNGLRCCMHWDSFPKARAIMVHWKWRGSAKEVHFFPLSQYQGNAIGCIRLFSIFALVWMGYCWHKMYLHCVILPGSWYS